MSSCNRGYCVFTEDLVLVPEKQDSMDTTDNKVLPLETTSTNAPTTATTTAGAEESGRKRNYPFVAPGQCFHSFLKGIMVQVFVLY